MRKIAIYVFFAVNVFIICGFWWRNADFFSGPASVIISLGSLAGLLAVFFVLLQFLLLGRAGEYDGNGKKRFEEFGSFIFGCSLRKVFFVSFG